MMKGYRIGEVAPNRVIAPKMAATHFVSPKPIYSRPFSFSSIPTNPPLNLGFPMSDQRKFFRRIPFSSSRNSSNTPSGTECPVPPEQLPINEFQSLSNSFPFSWASADVVEYGSRLFAMGACFSVFVGLPVSWLGSIGAKSEPVKLVLGATSSGVFVAILAVVRMYLGWAYVGNRLLSATVEYEETGWYDGRIWVKTAEVLARDRLLGSFSVKPVLSRLKNTLLVLGVSLYICIVFILDLESSQKYAYMESEEPGGRSVPGVYNEESARSFEPDAFCGESVIP